jgi:fructokinase
VIDDFPDAKVIAGSPLHVAAHLRAMGWDTHLLTRVGDDPDGRWVLSLLEERGIDTSLVEVDPLLPTGRVTVRLAGIEHTFTIHAPASWDRLTGPDRLPDHDVFAYGTLIGRSSRALETLNRLLLQTDALCALDVNLRPPIEVGPALRTGMGRAELVKMSQEEFASTAEMLGFDAAPQEFFSYAHRLRWLCITRGADGAELHDRAGRRWSVPGKKVAVVDTVGAGDAFFAGLIDALARGESERVALTTAQECAVTIITQRGGLPPI